MSVAKVIEISATSRQSFEDAINQGLARATRSLHGVTSAWVKEQEVTLSPGSWAKCQKVSVWPTMTAGPVVGPPKSAPHG